MIGYELRRIFRNGATDKERYGERNAGGLTDVNAKINTSVDSQIRIAENLFRTDESLWHLIAVVDRYLSEGRNGR
jgi:hypothetical protein